MFIKKTSIYQFISSLLVIVIFCGVFPLNIIAVEDNSNDITTPVEEWVYHPTDELPTVFTETVAPMLLSSGDEIQTTISAEDMVNVHVSAINKTTGLEEDVENATVRLFVGADEKMTETTDIYGNATISLHDLTLEEKNKATISADKIIARSKALEYEYGTGREALYDKYYPKDKGEYYRLSMELHSEWIDRNGNWNGTALPKSSASDKVDIVFAIDATGSMGDEINTVRTNIADFSQALINKGLDIRFCIIDYRDITQDEITNIHTVSGSHWLTDIDTVIDELAKINVNGGGDGPETPIDALGYIADTDTMRWRSDAHKFAYVLTDANYKDDNTYGYTDLDDITRTLAGLNIVTSVITSNGYKSAYSTLYNTTGGIYADIYASDFNAEMLTLSDNIIKTITREVSLVLSEPRMLVNMSVCYFANDKKSLSHSYYESVKNMLNEYANRIAETSDGHVLIDKILLFHTDNRLNFYDTSKFASMADIRIETEVKDDGTWWNNVQIHSNAHVKGFYTDYTYTAKYNDVDKEHFSHLKNGKELDGRKSFCRIQLSGTEGAGWNNSLIDDAYAYSTTVAHETGHYLFGFMDEYLDADGHEWNNNNGKQEENESQWNIPYSTRYGLMDNQHNDIEMSKAEIDYAYMTDGFETADKSIHTRQSWEHKGSCEDTMEQLIQYFVTDYQAIYTKASTQDRTARYSYANLSDNDYMSTTVSVPRTVSANSESTSDLNSDHPFTVSSDYFDSFEVSSKLLETVSVEGVGSTILFNITPLADYTYSLFHRSSGDDEEYNGIELTKSDNVYVAELPIDIGEIAEIRLVAKKDGKSSYNTYYVDRSNLTNVGYLYTSADNAVMAYVMADEESSYTFVADNTSLTNGDYVSVNQATIISSDNDITIGSGEIYSVASYIAEIDYTTLSWFQYKNGAWTQLVTDYSEEENMNIGARADLDGEGLYVLMAKKATVDDTVFTAENLSFTQSSDRDAVVTLSFDDKNTNSKYYNIYYSEFEFSDKNADNVVVRSYNAYSTDLILNLVERGRVVYAAIEIVLEDGSRSPLGTLIRLEAGAADSDGDRIPNWYCDKYCLWGKDGENKDIANSDDDGDGLTNLEEYQCGSDPTNPNDPIHTTNIPVTDVHVSENVVKLTVGGSKFITAIVVPENATNQTISWSIENADVATIDTQDMDCTITGIAIGTTKLYITTLDGGYTTTVDIEVVEDIEHDHYTEDIVYENNSEIHWKICDICGESYAQETHTISEWIIDTEPTLENKGLRHTECIICGYVISTEVIPSIVVEHKYDIAFNPNGATGIMNPITEVTVGTEVSLPECTYVYDGYTFSHWTDGEATYAPGDTYVMPENDVTLTAVWEENKTYSVSFDPNGAEGKMPSINDLNVGDKITLPVCSYIYEGYAFSHWTDGVDKYKAGDIYVIGDKDVTFKAIWIENQDIKYDELIELTVGKTEQLKISGLFTRTTWETSDNSIVEVTSKGVIKGVAVGEAYITMTSKSIFSFFGSSKTTVYKVIVSEAVEKEPDAVITIGGTVELIVENNGGTVTWESSDETIAIVDENGIVTGIGEGSVVITATVVKRNGGWFFWWGNTTTKVEFLVDVVLAEE